MQLYITKTGTAFKIDSSENTYGPHVISHPFYKAGARGVSEVVKRMHYQAPEYMYKKAKDELNTLGYYHTLSPHKRGIWSEYNMYVHCVDNNRDYLGPYIS